ncbi:PREDICTED: receptor-like protein 12 [Ipomoea nil]|uniref:receptor-like protein 12 n=1 Tax=Ipomoea nil TaxID=35883 RepID=UPI0009018D2F|nr:PREDICTED: receptor-like protein 12 [Ipomoea nil]
MRIPLHSWFFLVCLLQIIFGIDILVVSGQCQSDQRSMLLQLKSSLKFDSTVSTKLARWNQCGECCVWPGVECDTSGRVTGLILDNETITGGIENSRALLSLQYLERLNLAFNSFNSIPIPVQIYKLTNLTYLNLSNAGFGGQIPNGISRLKRLVTLDLSTRFPIGPPLKLENPNLEKFFDNSIQVRELYLDGVDISAQRSNWCQALSSSLPNLKILSLRNCQVSGPIYPSLLKLRHLSVIYLDQNDLSSTVPRFLANFSNLRTLSLSSCNLHGAFPGEIFQTKSLEELMIQNNQNLSGSIPSFPENGSLRVVSVSYTQFSGSVPPSISNLSNLSRIEITNCKFSGPIPSTMAQLTSLIYMDFSFNNFTGSIPHFQLSKNLTYVDFSRNGLTGSLSSKHFEGLSEIVNIDLMSNLLSGRIPQSLFSLPSLQKLVLSNNKFDGQVDEYLNVSASQMDTLDLSSNRLNGSIPGYFFEFPKLNVLLLSSNSFNGRIQFESLQKLKNLTRFELSHNNLSVDVSTSTSASSFFPKITTLKMASCGLQKFPDLRTQSSMIYLDLSDNEIRGEIPNWIWNVGNGSLAHLNLSRNFLDGLEKPYAIPSSLSVLDLHSNQLQGQLPIGVAPSLNAAYLDYSNNFFNGSIPFDLGSYAPFASFLSLSNNSFTGTIPESICNASYLHVLDLSNNKLSGTLPSCLFNITGIETIGLGVLNLAENQISGNIPDSFPSNCALKTLDLSRNFFQGMIPKSLINCLSLEVLNVGSNKIVDTFPCLLKKLSSLRVLVLRSNQFHGDLHCGNANHSWPNLQIIDIASNKFSGKLSPKCFLNWKGMISGEDTVQPVQHIKFDYLRLNNFYYQDTVMVTIKGMETELVKILTVFTSVDFSSNNFHGIIPDTIGALNSLYFLNLSHNALTGTIPEAIGNLKAMESLDLSSNQLGGEIPTQLASLSFLSVFNLSFNRLSGSIPTGNQLNTFEATSYLGNPELCGLPLPKSCKKPPSSSGGPVVDSEFDWHFIFIGLGYGIGASVSMAALFFWKEGRTSSDKHLKELLKLIIPSYRFPYIRYNGGRVQAEEIIEDESPDDTDDSDEDEDEMEGKSYRGRYCVFCSKLDIHRKAAIHNPDCTCSHHHSSPLPPSITSSSTSLLVIYQKVI